jgi:hypothetical protein
LIEQGECLLVALARVDDIKMYGLHAGGDCAGNVPFLIVNEYTVAWRQS